MTSKSENASIIGVGVAACAVCCAGPILGFLAAIGIGTAVGFALVGMVALIVGITGTGFVLVRRRRTRSWVPVQPPMPVSVGLTDRSARS